MSAKKHVLVPENFTESNDLSKASLARFPHVSNEECTRLKRAKLIVALGSNGKIWRLLARFTSTSSWETGDGRVSKHIPWSTQEVMASEMRRRPIHELPDVTVALALLSHAPA